MSKHETALQGAIELVDEKADQLAAMLSERVDPAQFLSVVKSTITRNPRIAECLPLTIYGAIWDAARLGLQVAAGDGGAHGEFWLIPRRNKNLGGRYECTGMIGYKGFITLAKRAGVVTAINSQVVYQDEVRDGLIHLDLANRKVRHEVSFSSEIDRSDDKIVGAYALAWTPHDERPEIEVLLRDGIEKRRKVAAAKMVRGRPWFDWYPEMARKSVIRAMFQRGAFPLTVECARPREITGENPPTMLSDAMAIDDKYAPPKAIEVSVAPAEADTPAQPEEQELGRVIEE